MREDARTTEESREHYIAARGVRGARSQQVWRNDAKQRPELKNVPTLPAQNRNRRTVVRQRVTFASDGLNQRGFPAPVRAQDAHMFARVDPQRHVFQCGALTAHDGYVIQRQQCGLAGFHRHELGASGKEISRVLSLADGNLGLPRNYGLQVESESRALSQKKEMKTAVLTSRGGGVMQAKPSAACSLPCQAGLLPHSRDARRIVVRDYHQRACVADLSTSYCHCQCETHGGHRHFSLFAEFRISAGTCADGYRWQPGPLQVRRDWEGRHRLVGAGFSDDISIARRVAGSERKKPGAAFFH